MPAGRLQVPKPSPKLSATQEKPRFAATTHTFSTEPSTLVLPLTPGMPYQ